MKNKIFIIFALLFSTIAIPMERYGAIDQNLQVYKESEAAAKPEFPSLKQIGVKAAANLVNQNIITIETAKEWLSADLHPSLELELKRIQMENVD